VPAIINPHFNFYKASNEQNLTDDLIIETIQTKGYATVYLEREGINLDLLFGEDITSFFKKTHEIEMLIDPESVNGFGGDKDLLSKFGLESRNTITLIVSQTRWTQEVFEAEPKLQRPREGDLIYFPFTTTLFEIKSVDNKDPFFQLGESYIFKLRCEQFIYSKEKFDTQYESLINNIAENDFALPYTIQLAIGGSGTFLPDEMVFQGASLALSNASAKVISFDSISRILTLKQTVGEFTNVPIIGDTSGASWTQISLDLQNLDGATYIGMPDNKRLETQSNPLIDDSEKDPFSQNKYKT
jgi:hypothetical protein